MLVLAVNRTKPNPAVRGPEQMKGEKSVRHPGAAKVAGEVICDAGVDAGRWGRRKWSDNRGKGR